MNREEAVKSDLVEAVVAQLRQKLPEAQAEMAEAFARQYFSQVDPEDIAEHNAADLYGAVLSHLNFARHIQRGSTKLRVYNPRFEEHGWQSTHTVIEVVQDDMPFLVDSMIMEINRQGLAQHLIIHPVMKVVRDAEGVLQHIADGHQADEGRLESIIHAQVDRRTSVEDLHALEAGVRAVLGDVAVAVEDWHKMQHRVLEAITEIEEQPPQGVASTEEERAFLQWVANDHFTFLGHRDYMLTEENGETHLRAVPDSGLGILRELGSERSTGFSALPQEIRERAREPVALVLTKSNSRATVHRAAYLDYIGIKRFDAEGRVVGERRFLGLYTSVAYHAAPAGIPILRRKVAHVLARAAFLPNSHGAKTLNSILQQYPRDELFQTNDDELFDIAMGILRLGERLRTRLFVRRDPYGRFFSCLIYAPRENYNTELRQRFQAILLKAFDGHATDFEVQLSDSVLARILIIVRTAPGSAPEFDVRDLEARLVRASRRWGDQLHAALVDRCGEERGNALYARYRGAFPAGYREEHDTRSAAQDVELIDPLADDGLGLSLYVPLEAGSGQLRFKMVCRGAAAPLSVSLPMLESMGVHVIEERPYEVVPEGAPSAWIHDFGLRLEGVESLAMETLREAFQEAFRRVWHGAAENDNFNRLVTRALLGWREVALLRAYARYMRQAGSTFSQSYLEQTLSAYPALVRQLVELFRVRFDPDASPERDAHAQTLLDRIGKQLDDVANLDEDRILRQFLALIEATLRTNYFQRDANGQPKAWISFKLDPSRVPGMPEPRPAFEIFVYSPRMEGVHLRGGSVARGGLRWSDRMEDYRTEVLGLVKAQMVKNAVIVPVGSKGGFVVKQPPAGGDRDAMFAEGLECYRTFLRGMLDLTDNRVGGEVVPPERLVRRDGDDPYLVVAADKGTATFSDHANAVAKEYGFWLGDAFASGGSAGYDHKKMGITARGAWESVKRHFRELGHDIQNEDFTVVGVGDMSGDVFGNGMLLSPHIRLVAAFDHRHIFIDPTPDAATSHAERSRLFALPRSAWTDYDRKLISAGGGVWPRSAKSISLSAQARAALGIEREALTPSELIRAILLAPVDLLYNGGIGTYVKARAENNAEVGDRANDSIRVDAADLRAKVLGEGGNLGLTQRGRIEFALKGGKVYTDAIDNSAGVDCSDHEVNIKILLDAVVAAGDMTPKQRDALLVEMTDEVATLVLRDNYFQGQVISVTGSRAVELLDKQARYLRHLGNSGRLNRKLEFLPFDEELAERKARNQGLAAPELAVLLAYSKMELYEAVLASNVPEDPYIATALTRYFPKPLRERFAEQILAHPLRREIIATHVINSMINRVGASFVFRVQEESGAAPEDVVRAYTATREVFGLVDFWKQIESLDNLVDDAVQTGMITGAQQLIIHGTLWFLQRRAYLQDLAGSVARFTPGVSELTRNLPHLLAPSYLAELEQEAGRLAGLNVPETLARRAAGMDALHSALDIVEVGATAGRNPEVVAQVYSSIDERLNLHWLWRQIAALPSDSHWQGMARKAMLDDVASRMRELTAAVFRASDPADSAEDLLARWEAGQAYQLGRWEQVRSELQGAGGLDMAMVSVALRELRVLAPAAPECP
jgi:glutamate dehydrogenase